MMNVNGRTVCKDGWSVSIQASFFHYCSPRSSVGPWESFELGFPSEAEPLLAEYAEDKHNPTETVYPYVPKDVINRVIEKHGGKA